MGFKQFGMTSALVCILSGCATPHVVQSVKTTDISMNCRQLEMEMSEADRLREAAEKEKGMTGTNVAAVLFFWPAMIGTYSNANQAMAAADTRKAHLMGIYSQKKCGAEGQPMRQVEIIAPMSKSSNEKLVELKSLFEKNLITKEEYDTKRAKIVSEM